MKKLIFACATFFILVTPLYLYIKSTRDQARRDSIDDLKVYHSPQGRFSALRVRWVGEVPNSFCRVGVYIVRGNIDVKMFSYDRNLIFEDNCGFLTSSTGKAIPSPSVAWASDAELRIEYAVDGHSDLAQISPSSSDLLQEVSVTFTPIK